MKFLHISDLHIGKRVNEFSMIEDQKYILNEILRIIDKEAPDGVLLAGDLYDRPIPSAEAVQLFDRFLTQLAERKIPVYAISGNHDSAERIAFGSQIMSSSGICMSPVYDGKTEKYCLTDSYGEVWIHLLPFVRPATVRHGLEGEEEVDEIRTYQEAVQAALPQAAAGEEATQMVVVNRTLRGGQEVSVPIEDVHVGDLVVVRAGEQIPGDGDVIEGAASVDESAITGESAPVVREAGGDRSAVTGGTTVLSDWIIVKISSEPGQSFLDKMIAMVEGAARKKTPNEIALEIFLVALSIVFILVTLALYCYSCFSVGLNDMVNPTAVTTLVALLVCLAPTTIGALLSAIGIAGMSRLNEANVLAMSGRAIEAAGDVDILMLDKTGTITLGNRQAAEFIPVDGIDPAELADAAQLSSLADETPEGRSIVVLAKEQFGLRGRTLEDKGMEFIPFTAATRMSGVNYEGNEIRKGAADSVRTYVEAAGGVFSQECDEAVERIAKAGGTLQLGRMGPVAIDAGGEAALAPPFTYNKDNVDKFSKIF